MTKGIFIGDAAMNGYPSSHRVTIWVENTDEFGRSWDLLMAEKAEILYPAHRNHLHRKILSGTGIISAV